MKATQLLLVGSLAIALSGCATTLRQNEAIAQQIRQDQIRFYEYLASSYFLLGYEYFTLAHELKEQDSERSLEAAEKARLYREHSKELNSSARLLRDRYNLAKQKSQVKVLPQTKAQPPGAPPAPAPGQGS